MFEHWFMKKFPALFAGGGLSEKAKARFDVHLERCSRCRDEVRRLTGLQERLRADSIPLPSPHQWSEFNRRLRRSIEERNRQFPAAPALGLPHPRAAWFLPAGAAALLLALSSALLLIKGASPPGADFAAVDADTLVLELADFENNVLEELIGNDFPVSEGWMNLLTDAADEDMEAIQLSVSRSEEEIWGDPDLLDEVIEEVLS